MSPTVAVLFVAFFFREMRPAVAAAEFRAKIAAKYGIEPTPNDSPIRKLQKERCVERAIAIAQFKEVIAIDRFDTLYLPEYIKLHVTLAENLADLTDKPADRLKCYETCVGELKEFERFVKARVDSGTDPPQHLNIAKAARLDAELAVASLKPLVGEKN